MMIGLENLVISTEYKAWVRVALSEVELENLVISTEYKTCMVEAALCQKA